MINGWEISKGHVYMVSTVHAHMDEFTWNTDSGKRLVLRFWLERSLDDRELQMQDRLKTCRYPYPLQYWQADLSEQISGSSGDTRCVYP